MSPVQAAASVFLQAWRPENLSMLAGTGVVGCLHALYFEHAEPRPAPSSRISLPSIAVAMVRGQLCGLCGGVCF
jgi:hypothetical protein